MVFVNNTAVLAGAGIYANDMSRCKWLGNITENYTIFQIPPAIGGPFQFINNTVQGKVTNNDLATESSKFSARVPLFNTSTSTVAFGEQISFRLSSEDELMNFREAVWSVTAPLEPQVSPSPHWLYTCSNVYLLFVFQPLGSLSSNNSRYVYSVPDKLSLVKEAGVSFENGSEEITAEFTLLQSLVSDRDTNLC